MRKIPSLFVRLERSSLVNTDIVTPGCGWVFQPQTHLFISIKRDGTPVLYREGLWYQRRTLKSKLDPGADGIPKPLDFTPCQPAPGYDDESKQWEWPGWVPLEAQFKKLVDEAVTSRGGMKPEEAGFTFELCGPKINGNPERLDTHHLFVHASEIVMSIVQDTPLTPTYLMQVVKTIQNEGIVIYSGHVENGAMQCAKLKKRDLGLDWPIKVEVASTETKN